MNKEIIEIICKCIIICICFCSLSTCIAKIEPKRIYIETKTQGDCINLNLSGIDNANIDK